MADREKVIEILSRHKAMTFGDKLYDGIQFDLGDVVDLLKEQEPKSVCWRLGRAHCPSCGELFPKKQDKQYIRFCNWCGQAVKWE